MAQRKVWVVRGGNNNEIIDIVESQGIVALGLYIVGDVSGLKTRDEFRERNPKSDQLFRFVHEMQIGDTVLTPNKATRRALVGRIKGEYRYDPSIADGEYPHVRDVEWQGSISRDDMSPKFRNSMGSTLTVFTIEGYEDEIRRILSGDVPTPEEKQEEEETFDFLAETQGQAEALIADHIESLAWDDFELLVAAVLRTLGFRTKLSKRGADGGYDIVAHPDALGFEEPRVKVEVKHRKGAMGGPDVRNFRSTVRKAEKGLYVSTGGFKGDAKAELEKEGPPLALMDQDEFISLLTENYENLEPEFQALVPLRGCMRSVHPYP